MPLVEPPLQPFASAFDQAPDPAVPANHPVPLLVFLHGRDEFGETGGRTPEEQVKRHGPWEVVHSIWPATYRPGAIAEQRRFRVLGLHGVPDNGDWEPDQVSAAIDEYSNRHPINIEQICLTGISRGGRGALRTAIYRLQNNRRVYRIAVFCPEPNLYTNPQIAILTGIPIFLFHAESGDPHIPLNSTQTLQNRIASAGGQSALRIVRTNGPIELRWPESPHVCWTCVYGDPAFYGWLIDPLPGPNAWPQIINPLPCP